MSYPISDVTRRVVYSGSAGTGPYSFSFEVLVNTDIAVYKNTTLLTLTTNYTVHINTDGTGYVTLVSAATSSDNITLVGNRAIERATDFVTGGDLFANSLNDEFDSLVIFSQQVSEKADRGLKAPITDPTDVNMTLPAKASRKGKVLAFDSTSGNPINGPALDSVVTVVEQSANINTVANNITNVNTVAGNTTNINTVAGISSNVTTVAGNSSNVTTVASNISSVNSAATNMAAIIAAPTQASNAASSASAAASSATSASNSAAAAAASAASGMYSSVQEKSANYSVVAADDGDLIRVTTSGGARTITLPQIGSTDITDGFKIAIVKWTGDGNAVTVARSSTDTINGATSYTIGNQYSSATFVADAETGQWFAAASGLGTSNANVDVFSGNNSTVAFTLSGDPGAKNNTAVMIGGVYQAKSTYSISGTTLTFTSAPPTGTSNIEVVWNSPLAIGTPSDDTVSTAKLQAGAVTPAKMSTGGPFWDTNGNVGIGTSSPNQKLNVAGSISSSGGSQGFINYDRTTNALSNTIYSPVAGQLRIYDNVASVDRIILDASGNFLILTAAGLGYGTGSGGTVTQATSKSTAVTLNKPTGQITMNNAALAANTVVNFNLNNSLVASSDLVVVNDVGGMAAYGTYIATARVQGSGVVTISLRNITGGSLSEAVVLNFAIIKGATA